MFCISVPSVPKASLHDTPSIPTLIPRVCAGSVFSSCLQDLVAPSPRFSCPTLINSVDPPPRFGCPTFMVRLPCLQGLSSESAFHWSCLHSRCCYFRLSNLRGIKNHICLQKLVGSRVSLSGLTYSKSPLPSFEALSSVLCGKFSIPS
ncbi:hypothetical protein INT44_008037 [Umbelopsis vinacea]|uniref:Uncharacterized protein n=1 Tax=Umbelopsis vinacea TaxID=44442 RepID=A0A8H7PQQ1_9FUNG|nr:hypothetical protein INT44_008037 [Umbelopsis vinacea]